MHSSTPTRAKKSPKLSVPLRILNVNFQSVKMKKDRLLNILESTKPDVLIGTETWLTPDITSSEIFPSGYTIYRKDRTSKVGGGVLLAMRSELDSEEVPELDSDCELIWAKINLLGNKTLYLCAFYRHNVSDEISLTNLQHSLAKTPTNGKANLIIGGDFNLPGWDWSTMTLKPKTVSPSLHKYFNDVINDHGLEQLVRDPTRKDNILDLLLTNCPHEVFRVEVIPGLSDYDAVLAEFDLCPVKIRQKPRPIALFHKADWDSISLSMESTRVQLQTIYDGNASSSVMWDTFRDSITSSVKKFIPHKVASNKNGNPWIDTKLKRLLKKQQRVYNRMKKSGTEQLKSEYANLKRTAQRELRRSYWSYIENILDPADTNSQSAQNQFSTMKRFWSYIKHRRKDSSCVASLKVNGKLYSNSADKANILNGQFQQAFSTDNKQAVGEAYFDPVALETPALEDIVISCLGVEKLLQNLVPHKAAGPDTISPRVLKSLSSEIAPLLTLIFRRSLDTGDVPADWRKASVCPVYKKGPKYLAENYRPISLTSIACKIFEHLIASAIMKHAESNHLLYHLQHGFRKGRSCESQLIDLIDDVTKNLDEGRQTDMLVMDFAKAFDKVTIVSSLKNSKITASKGKYVYGLKIG